VNRIAVHVRGVWTEVDPLRAGPPSRASARRPSRACWRSARRADRSRPADLCRRLDLNRVNRRVLEALIRSGAMDFPGREPRHPYERPRCRDGRAAEQQSRAQAAGQVDLFGLATPVPAEQQEADPALERLRNGASPCAWPASARRSGSTSPGHRSPSTSASSRRSSAAESRTSAARGRGRGRWRLARTGPQRHGGGVLEIRKRGNRVSFVLEIAAAASSHPVRRGLPASTARLNRRRDAILVVEGNLRFDDFADDWRIAARRIIGVAQAREQYARRLVLRWPSAVNGDGQPGDLGAGAGAASESRWPLRPVRDPLCRAGRGGAGGCWARTGGCGRRRTSSSGSARSSARRRRGRLWPRVEGSPRLHPASHVRPG